jgi:hypothetical protein
MNISDIQDILNEAASIISGIENPETIKGFRHPIVDELHGFALMLPEIVEKARQDALQSLANVEVKRGGLMPETN